ncbi:MAG: nitronate monooxygenase [Tissierellia bacterium]|jgi:NAD(P)H-dependent flavin oxidoreductase YrpB (nitropropane dioxygenase family)|nr:nitronate monooxygenase [Tissierellia bacterium]MDD3226149.1 nitronate monooxygenase [Tissierellia bacterium]MDD4045537.1 nitronate monooxygenase [Tissierellia bacterium]MDD4678882.1 nitronate monooxygenase [Tissierellia bacterium]
MILNELKIGNLTAKIPIVQGGMGVGVSLANLAAAVANEGGIGTISGVQIGFREPDFLTDPIGANLRAIKKEIKKAREKTKGIIAMNFMAAMNNYELYVKKAVEEKIDLIVSGAGLPMALPKLVKGSSTKIVPIVSSAKAAKIIIRSYLKSDKLPDAVVVEGPLAGGHLGFKMDELLEDKCMALIDIVKEVKLLLSIFEEKYKVKIPLIAAGGIRTKSDIIELKGAGADGFQIASLFVPTVECDAHQNFKSAYINATDDQIEIIKSPVGMPGRAIKTNFLSETGKFNITKCYRCMPSCNPKDIPYCISEGLINSVQGRDGLIFSGADLSNVNKMTTVKEVIDKLIR